MYPKRTDKFSPVVSAVVAGLAGVMPVLPSMSQADTSILFAVNPEDGSVFPSEDPANNAPFGSQGGVANPDFRVIIGGNVSGGGEKQIGPGVMWTFDGQTGDFVSVTGSDVTPGAAAYGTKGPDGQLGTADDIPSAAPGGDIGLFKNAPFLGSPFGFLAPIVGSAAAAQYGVGQLTFGAGDDFSVTFPVTEAQWAGGPFAIGRANGGVIFSATTAADKHNFSNMAAERIIANPDDSLGFAGQYTQWEDTGVINSDPETNQTGYTTLPNTVLVISVAELATDREGDTLSIQTPTPPVSGSAGGSVNCTASACTYTPVGASGSANFTVTVDDDFAQIPGTTDVSVTVAVTSAPVAVPDFATVEGDSTNNSVDLLVNDTASNGIDSASITNTAPANGTVGSPPPGDGTVLYSPNIGFAGTDTFTYTFDDLTGATSNSALVTVTVNCASACSSLGQVTAASLTGNIKVTAAEITAAGVPPDEGAEGVATSCAPNCFDFVAPATGGQAQVVFALDGPVQADSRYRKVKNGVWDSFDTGSGDTFGTAAGNPGSCPPPGDPAYSVNSLREGDLCVQLTIADGGSNDADGVVDGQVVDPGGIGVGATAAFVRGPQTLSSAPTASSFGCSLGRTGQAGGQATWWLLGAALVWLRFSSARRK